MTATHLVILSGGQPVTTTEAIAEGVGHPHKSVIQLVRGHRSDLEDFGLLAFEMRPRPPGQHGGGKGEIAILNEPQATYLLTLMRNNEVVRAFKKALVKAFYELRSRAAPAPELAPPAALPKAAPIPDNMMLIETGKYIQLLESQIHLLQQGNKGGRNRGKPAPQPLTVAEKQQILRRHAEGAGRNAIARELGRSPSAVHTVIREAQAAQGGAQ